MDVHTDNQTVDSAVSDIDQIAFRRKSLGVHVRWRHRRPVAFAFGGHFCGSGGCGVRRGIAEGERIASVDAVEQRDADAEAGGAQRQTRGQYLGSAHRHQVQERVAYAQVTVDRNGDHDERRERNVARDEEHVEFATRVARDVEVDVFHEDGGRYDDKTRDEIDRSEGDDENVCRQFLFLHSEHVENDDVANWPDDRQNGQETHDEVQLGGRYFRRDAGCELGHWSSVEVRCLLDHFVTVVADVTESGLNHFHDFVLCQQMTSCLWLTCDEAVCRYPFAKFLVRRFIYRYSVCGCSLRVLTLDRLIQKR